MPMTIDLLNSKYRYLLDPHDAGFRQASSAGAVPADATRARLRREGKSHRGIRERTALKTLVADGVDQDFLEEIACLPELTHLELAWPTTATNLTPLTALEKLRVLKIDSPRNILDFSALLQLPALEALFIENARHLTSIDWLRPLATRLRALGIEGSMTTIQRLPTLAPLAGFEIEALFLTSTRIADRNLDPLHTMPNLIYLNTARIAPREAFARLHAAKPKLICDWFNEKMWAR